MPPTSGRAMPYCPLRNAVACVAVSTIWTQTDCTPVPYDGGAHIAPRSMTHPAIVKGWTRVEPQHGPLSKLAVPRLLNPTVTVVVATVSNWPVVVLRANAANR